MNFQLGIWNGSSYDRAAKFKKKLNSRPQTVIILALTLVKLSGKIHSYVKFQFDDYRFRGTMQSRTVKEEHAFKQIAVIVTAGIKTASQSL